MSFLSTLKFIVQRTFCGIHFPIGISVDITSKCNLKCSHCYYQHQNHSDDLTDSEMLHRIRELKLKYPSAVHGAWVGGEPLLRLELIRECTNLFPLNMIVTNGTIELPKLNNCVFNVSVDGTKEYHNQIRGKSIYDLVKKNTNRDDVPVNIACVLNKINSSCIEDLLSEWSQTKVRGISFGFYTPQKNTTDNLFLQNSEKDLLIDRIIHLKKKYGDFIMNSKSVLTLMKSTNSSLVTSNCISPKAFVSIDSSGNVKSPCVMGHSADCTKCGCLVPFQLKSVLVKKSLDSLLLTKKFYAG